MQKYKSVQDFLDDLDIDKRAQVDALRSIILEAEPELEERIKWNAPSHVLDGEDRITFNLMNKQGAVKLILHMGATRKEDKKSAPIMQDPSGLVEWSSDIRGILTIVKLEDITSHQTALRKIITEWLSVPS